jgi:hypothetical protein
MLLATLETGKGDKGSKESKTGTKEREKGRAM